MPDAKQNLKLTQFEEQLRNQATQEMNSIYQSFTHNAQADLPRLPENIFRDYFLPQFAGKVAAGDNFLNEWIGVAGTAMTPVVIIDIHGQDMFRVPPLFSTNFLRLGQELRSVSFHHLFERAKQQGNRLPQLGTVAVASAAKVRYGDTLRTAPATQDEQAWHEIFVRYGYVLDANQQGAGAYLDQNNGSDELQW